MLALWPWWLLSLFPEFTQLEWQRLVEFSNACFGQRVKQVPAILLLYKSAERNCHAVGKRPGSFWLPRTERYPRLSNDFGLLNLEMGCWLSGEQWLVDSEQVQILPWRTDCSGAQQQYIGVYMCSWCLRVSVCVCVCAGTRKRGGQRTPLLSSWETPSTSSETQGSIFLEPTDYARPAGQRAPRILQSLPPWLWLKAHASIFPMGPGDWALALVLWGKDFTQ